MKEKLPTGMTVREVARELGMSRAAVHRIERAAIAKVREAAKQAGLTAEDLFAESPARPASRGESS